MNMLVIIFLFMAAFAIQYFFTFMQMRNFVKIYKQYRYEGYLAAIGRFAGAFHEGAIVMFAITKEGKIIKSVALHGVTVLARFKSFDKFNNYNIKDLDKKLCKEEGLSYSLTRAVTNATENYNLFMRGEEIPTPPSPFQRIGNLFSSGIERLQQTFNGIRS